MYKLSRRSSILYNSNLRYIFDGLIGVDEVGRGAGAGPLLACAVALPWHSLDLLKSALFKGELDLKDSKLLTPLKREMVMNWLDQRKEIKFSISWLGSNQVDEIGVRRASIIAMSTAVRTLLDKFPLTTRWLIIVDGRDKLQLTLRDGSTQLALISADKLYLPVSLASIIAKVTRDKMMRELSPHFPWYSWESNVGYMTPEHKQAIKLYGPSPFHRYRFLKGLIGEQLSL